MEQSYPPSSEGAPPAYEGPPQSPQPVYTPKKPQGNTLSRLTLLLAIVALVIGIVSLAMVIDTRKPVDTDMDGHPNDVDVFPHDPTEWLDTDTDGVGDNADYFPNDGDSSTRQVIESDSWTQNAYTGGEIFFYVPPDADYLEYSFSSDAHLEFRILNEYTGDYYVQYVGSSTVGTVDIAPSSAHPEDIGVKSGLWKVDYENDHSYEVSIEMSIVLVT